VSDTINQVESSTPILKKIRECNACGDAEVPHQLIGFEKKEDNSITVKPFGNQKTKKVKD
jgi:hypothetical protein